MNAYRYKPHHPVFIFPIFWWTTTNVSIDWQLRSKPPICKWGFGGRRICQRQFSLSGADQVENLSLLTPDLLFSTISYCILRATAFGSQNTQHTERKLGHAHSLEGDGIKREVQCSNSSMRESSFTAEKGMERHRGKHQEGLCLYWTWRIEGSYTDKDKQKGHSWKDNSTSKSKAATKCKQE